jgi:hypothetical protein
MRTALVPFQLDEPMITHTNRKTTKRETVRPATFGDMAGYYPKLVGTALDTLISLGHGKSRQTLTASLPFDANTEHALGYRPGGP